MVYFLTFTTKSQANVGKYTNHPMDPMGICVYCIWSNYSDLTRPIFPKWWFSKGNPLISWKSRLVKYYSIWPDCIHVTYIDLFIECMPAVFLGWCYTGFSGCNQGKGIAGLPQLVRYFLRLQVWLHKEVQANIYDRNSSFFLKNM